MEDISRDTVFDDIDDLLAMFEGDYGSSRGDWKSFLAGEVKRFVDLDFDLYVEEKHNKNIISADVRDTLILVKSTFETFVNATQPTLAQTEQFWQDKITALNAFGGCNAEKELLLVYYESAIGFARYLYTTFNQSSFSSSSVDFRTCTTFWQHLLCGTAGLIGGVASGVILWDLSGNAEATVIIQGVRILEGTPARIVASVVVGVYAAVNIYNWCCSGFGNEPPCRNPTGVGYRVLACNQYELTVYGAGNSIVSYMWNNVNTIPATATTQLPFLTVSVPNPGQPSRISVVAVCAVQEEGVEYRGEWERTLSSSEPGALGWAIAPPLEASVGQTIQVAVSADIAFPQTLSWSASFGGGVSPTGTHTANVTFWASGSVTITATLTNTCTGQPVSVSRTVEVKP